MSRPRRVYPRTSAKSAWIAGPGARAAVVASLAAELALAGCGILPAPAPARLVSLVEVDRYQKLFDAQGRPLRVLYDADGDGRAELVTLFDALGHPASVEADTDGDGVVDRWETYAAERLLKLGRATAASGRADSWVHFGRDGDVVRREWDDDRDGVIDRTELLEAGRVAREERDTDHDGRIDLWSSYAADRVVVEQFDTDADGRPDRRITRDADGKVVSVEIDPSHTGRWRRLR